jgi:uncharacterized membrane protein
MEMQKTSLGLDENIETMLSYLVGPFTGILFLVLEKENKTVKFHAMQSTIFFGLLMVLSFVFSVLDGIFIIGAVFAIANWLLGIVTVVSWVYLMYMAFKGNIFKIPYIGESVWSNINK